MRRHSFDNMSRSRDRSLQRWAERLLGGGQQQPVPVVVHNEPDPPPAGPENLDEIAVANLLQPELNREEPPRVPNMPARNPQIGHAHLEYVSNDPLGTIWSSDSRQELSKVRTLI
jgi:hypothetical protein